MSREHATSVLTPSSGPATADSDRLKQGAKVVIAGYLLLVAAMLVIGFTLTHLDTSVGRWDESVNRWFADHRTEHWNQVTSAATWFVNTVPAIVAAAIITVVLVVRHRRREAAMLVIALTLELLVFLSVSFVIGRPRPNVPRLNATPSTSSFPSGHTAAATVLLAGLAIIVTCCTHRAALRVLFFVVAVAGATLVGFARVYRGMHHPTDVFAGALLGAACLVVAVLSIRATAAPRSEEAAVTNTGERTS